MDNNQASGNGAMNERDGYLGRISVFWLIVGGLMLFFGAAAILHRVGIWSEVDADNAGDAVVIMLGLTAVAYALRGHHDGRRTESA